MFRFLWAPLKFFRKLLAAFWALLVAIVAGSLLPYIVGLIRDSLVSAGIDVSWARIGGPEKMATAWIWMQTHPLQSAVYAAASAVVIAATLSEWRDGRSQAAEAPPVQRHEHIHRWEGEKPPRPNEPPRFGPKGVQVILYGFGISQYHTAKTDDGVSYLVKPTSAYKPTDSIHTSLSMKVELINRSDTPASLRFALTGRNPKTGQIMQAFPDPEFAVAPLIFKTPYETFLYEPVRVEPNAAVTGIVWFLLNCQDEEDIPMDVLDVYDLVTAQSGGMVLPRALREQAARPDFNGHTVLFVRR